MNKAYVKKSKIGEDAYATIFLADQVETLNPSKIIKENEEYVKLSQVAIKRIKKITTGFGIEVSAIRELKALQKVNNKYVLKLMDVFIYNRQVHIVLEYLETNLDDLIRNKDLIFMPADIKAWMLMILKGTYACHKKFVVHRDIKPINILCNSNGDLKLADFGLAKDINGNKMTNNVVTRWYRAPELLMGAVMYSFGVDMWSIACIFAELFLRVPLLCGNSDIQQLEIILKVLGTPNQRDWPGMTNLKNYIKFPNFAGTPLDHLLAAASPDAVDLIKKMFVFDPLKRITCLNAIKHLYFTKLPNPTVVDKLPSAERSKVEI